MISANIGFLYFLKILTKLKNIFLKYHNIHINIIIDRKKVTNLITFEM